MKSGRRIVKIFHLDYSDPSSYLLRMIEKEVTEAISPRPDKSGLVRNDRKEMGHRIIFSNYYLECTKSVGVPQELRRSISERSEEKLCELCSQASILLKQSEIRLCAWTEAIPRLPINRYPRNDRWETE